MEEPASTARILKIHPVIVENAVKVTNFDDDLRFV